MAMRCVFAWTAIVSLAFVSLPGILTTAHAVPVSSPTTTTLVASPFGGVVGESIELTATLTSTSGGVPNESITFENVTFGTTLGSATTNTVGVAQLSETFMIAGMFTLEATFAGDANFFGSNGSTQVSIAPAPITPIPAALPLFATGLGALGLLGWRRKRKAQAFA